MISGDKESATTRGFISNEAIQSLNRQANDHNPTFSALMEEIANEYTSSYQYPVGNSIRDGRLQFSTFNQGADSEYISLVVLGWGSNYRKPGAARGLATLALNDPSQRFVVCNFMGRGDSTPLPISRSLAIAKTGSYIPAGELLQGALRQVGVLSDAEGVRIVAESEGHRLAMGAVASGLEIKSGIFIDGPGALKLGLLGLARAFKNTENTHGKQYRAFSEDNWSQRPEEAVTPPYKEIIGLASQGVGRALAHYILHPAGLSKAGLEADTAQALPNIKQNLTVISLAESAITSHTQVDAMLRGVAANSNEAPVVIHRVVSGLTHSYNLAGPGLRANLLTAKSGESE